MYTHLIWRWWWWWRSWSSSRCCSRYNIPSLVSQSCNFNPSTIHLVSQSIRVSQPVALHSNWLRWNGTNKQQNIISNSNSNGEKKYNSFLINWIKLTPHLSNYNDHLSLTHRIAKHSIASHYIINEWITLTKFALLSEFWCCRYWLVYIVFSSTICFRLFVCSLLFFLVFFHLHFCFSTSSILSMIFLRS